MNLFKSIAALIMLLSSLCSFASPSCIVKPYSSFVITVENYKAIRNDNLADNIAIQNAINIASSSRGSVYVPSGIYMIDALHPLRMRSNVSFVMAPDAVLRVIPNDAKEFYTIYIGRVSNVNIRGGIMQGERYQHKGKIGEWGIAVYIAESHNINIENVVMRDNWGDAIDVEWKSTDIKVCKVTAYNNRRVGIAISSVDKMLIQDSTFNQQNGTAPESGIDLEPNTNGDSSGIHHLKIINSIFVNNFNDGIVSYGKNGDVSGVLIQGNVFKNNRGWGISAWAINKLSILNNTIVKNGAGAKFLRSSYNSINNNTITNNLENGLLFSETSEESSGHGNKISGNEYGNVTDLNGSNDINYE